MNKARNDERSLGRIVGFSDGVYAIAITLLVLTLEIPENLHFTSNADVIRLMADFRAGFFAYLISFYIIGMYWQIHHRMFRDIVKYDEKLIMLNLITLFFVSFIPVPTALLSRAGDISLGAAFYALWIVFCSGSMRILWNYAYKQKLFDKSITKSYVRYTNLKGAIPLIVFCVSIPVAFFNPYLAEAVWAIQLFLSPRYVAKILGMKVM